MGKLFGTDGVRGLANADVTPELAYNLGRAGAYVLTKGANHAPRILIGTDSRLSGEMLRCALTAGMLSVGATAVYAGIIPTPAIAYLTKNKGFDAGVMISASHNPFYDNGIKFFNRNGFKLSDELENEIEELLLENNHDIPRAINEQVGRAEEYESAIDDYLEFLKGTMDGVKLDGLKIALDCSNGATSEAAAMIFYMLGAEVFVTANEPNGLNINHGVGSTHIENLISFSKECGADLGFAYDGDGDRLICVDNNASEVDGDMIMSILAAAMKKAGTLKKDTVVATVMSNLGFFKGCRAAGINVLSTKVGDRYILEKMLEDGYNLGGEQSGHVIMLEYSTTGDGILTSLQLARHIKLSGKKLSEINDIMRKMPQVLFGAKVSNDKKNDYVNNAEIEKRIKMLNEKYQDSGRILIRPSGTEPLVRVMIEGEDIEEITNDAKTLAEFIEGIYS